MRKTPNYLITPENKRHTNYSLKSDVWKSLFFLFCCARRWGAFPPRKFRVFLPCSCFRGSWWGIFCFILFPWNPVWWSREEERSCPKTKNRKETHSPFVPSTISTSASTVFVADSRLGMASSFANSRMQISGFRLFKLRIQAWVPCPASSLSLSPSIDLNSVTALRPILTSLVSKAGASNVQIYNR